MPDAIDEFLDAPRNGGQLSVLPMPIQTAPGAATNAALSASTNTLLPRIDFGAINSGGRNAPSSGFTITPSLDFQARNQRLSATGEPIPIDTTTGIGNGDYLRVAAQRGSAAQLATLRDMYPDKNPRMLDNGDLAITLDDLNTGQPKDVVLNPHGLDSHDLIDLAVQTPEIAASIATAIATRGTGFIKTAAQIVASAIAGGAVGAARDTASRALEGIPIDFKEIATARTEQAALDAFGQSALTVGAKSLRLISPFASDIKPDTLEFNLQKGREFFKDTFGEDYPITPAEKTGSTALKSIESIEAPQPGARTVMGKLQQARDAVVQRIQARALGQVTPEETIGENAINTLRTSVVNPLEDALTIAKEAAITKGEQRLTDLLDNTVGSPSGPRMTPSMAGAKTLDEFDTKLEAAQTNVKAAYDAVKALPGGTGDVLSGDPAASAAMAIRQELPNMVKDGARTQLESGIPEGLNKALTELESLQGSHVSLQTLTAMKNAAYDEIAKTEAVPGVKDRWYGKIAKAYEQGIEQGIANTGDPALKAALTNAKETYKKELLPFDRPGLRELARSEFDAGRLSPEQVATRLFDGPKAIENYQMLKQTLGANSPAFATIKRAWLDTHLAAVTDPVTGRIDAAGLERVFKDLQVNKPELAKEFLGNNYEEISHTLRVQNALHKLTSLDDSEAKVLLGLKNPGARDLEALMVMQANRDNAYMNGILKDVANGTPIASRLKPTEFVSRLRNTKTPTADVEKVLATLPPDQRDAIATAQLYQILSDASLSDAATATKSLSTNPLNISATKLAEAFGRGGTAERARNELLLGGGTVAGGTTRKNVIENLVNILAPTESRNELMGTAGKIAGSTTVLNALKKPLAYASSYVQKAIYALAYTSKPGVAVIGNTVMSPARSAAAANFLIASEPFVRRAVETFGSEGARNIISEAKSSIDKVVNGLTEDRKRDTPANRQSQAIDDFLNGKSAPVRVSPMR
jgi:hypothetical protein